MARKTHSSALPSKANLLWGAYPLQDHCCLHRRGSHSGAPGHGLSSARGQQQVLLPSAGLLQWAVCTLGLFVSLALHFSELPCSLQLFLPHLPSPSSSFTMSYQPCSGPFVLHRHPSQQILCMSNSASVSASHRTWTDMTITLWGQRKKKCERVGWAGCNDKSTSFILES